MRCNIHIAILFCIPLLGINLACVGQVKYDFAIIEFTKDYICKSNDQPDKGFRFNRGEQITTYQVKGYNYKSGRYFLYGEEELFIKYNFKSKAYRLILDKQAEGTNHSAGNWPINYIKKVLGDGEEVYLIDASWMPEIKTKPVNVYTYSGYHIITLTGEKPSGVIGAYQLEDGQMIRIVMQDSHTRLYEIPIGDVTGTIQSYPISNDYMPGDSRVIIILKNALVNSTDSTIKQSILLHPNELYISSDYPDARLIKYQNTEYLIPFKINSELVYDKKEAAPLSNHIKGEWNMSYIKKRMKGGIDYFRIDATWLPELDTTQIIIYNFYGDKISILSKSKPAVDFEKGDLKNKSLIRVVVPGQLTRLYKIPQYDNIPIDKEYYESITDEYDEELYWEKKHGFIYVAVPPGNLELKSKLSPNKTETIILQGRHKAILFAKGEIGKIINLSKTESFWDKIINLFKQNIMLVAIILIIFILAIIIVVFRKKVANILSPLIGYFLPYELHTVEVGDTLERIAEKYDVKIDDIKETNFLKKEDLGFNIQPRDILIQKVVFLKPGDKIEIPKKQEVIDKKEATDKLNPQIDKQRSLSDSYNNEDVSRSTLEQIRIQNETFKKVQIENEALKLNIDSLTKKLTQLKGQKDRISNQLLKEKKKNEKLEKQLQEINEELNTTLI